MNSLFVVRLYFPMGNNLWSANCDISIKQLYDGDTSGSSHNDISTMIWVLHMICFMKMESNEEIWWNGNWISEYYAFNKFFSLLRMLFQGRHSSKCSTKNVENFKRKRVQNALLLKRWNKGCKYETLKPVTFWNSHEAIINSKLRHIVRL